MHCSVHSYFRCPSNARPKKKKPKEIFSYLIHLTKTSHLAGLKAKKFKREVPSQELNESLLIGASDDL